MKLSVDSPIGKRGTSLWAALLIGCCGLVGCYPEQLTTKDSLEINDYFSQYWHKQLLLNMVRASQREPMYFAAITSLQEGYTVSGSAGITSPFPHTATNFFTAPFTVGISGGPTMVIGPLDTDKFMKGFLQPVDLKTVQLYFDARWPIDVLLHVFVGEVNLKIVNPKNAAELTKQGVKDSGRYTSLVEALAPETDQKSIPPDSSKILTLSAKGNLREEALYDDPLNPQTPELQDYLKYLKVISMLARLINEGKVELSFEEEVPIGASAAIDPKTSTELLKLGLQDGYKLKSEGEQLFRLYKVSKAMKLKFEDSTVIEGKFHFRSPEVILYYFGELLRYCEKFDRAPVILPLSRRPLFFARKERPGDKALLSVTHGKDVYVIPQEPGDPLLSIRLISQLVMLYKSSDSVPAAGVVPVITSH